MGLQRGRADAAMTAAYKRYGRDFERAYQAADSLDPNNPVARSIVMGILNDADPGEALMNWYDQTGGRRQPAHLGGHGGAGRLPPSLNDAEGGRTHGRGGGKWNEGHGARGEGGFVGDEADIFASAFR
jgi:hypothetical protein